MSSQPEYPGRIRCKKLKAIKKDISDVSADQLNVTALQKSNAIKAIENAIEILCPEG